MDETGRSPIAIVAMSAIMPDAPDMATFWDNLTDGRYAIADVPSTRWDPDWYYDPDPAAPDKTYSRIGGWVREFDWDPMAWRLPIPPKVADAMDDAQKWAVSGTRALLEDYGADRDLDRERTAVILGNAMAGEKHYRTAFRVDFPQFADELRRSATFAALPADQQAAILEEARAELRADVPDITEDTMPGELANIIAGRVANIFDLHGPNFVVDAACASAMAAFDAAIEGLDENEFDAVITGGIDRNMGAATFVKFCKIGALSATGTRPYGDGADGFVMGEGAALFLLKRLEDAERDGDRIYAVVRGVAGSSDGKGKGITAPNPKGQRLAIERAWQSAGVDPSTASYVEGHGTSTKVGDVVECESLTAVFGPAGAEVGSIALGSVKSNIGHLKGAAGAAGVLKTALAIHHGVLPPSLNSATPNPNIEFSSSPLRVVSELEEWQTNGAGVRRAGVSAFGFGGTNFHLVLEEHQPGRLTSGGSGTATTTTSATQRTHSDAPTTAAAAAPMSGAGSLRPPLRGAAFVGAADETELATRLTALADAAAQGQAPAPAVPQASELAAAERVAIDFDDAADLADKAVAARDALGPGKEQAWRLLANRGIYRGSGPAGKVAFLFTGQGSQYVNMLAGLRERDNLVRDTFDDADEIMTPLLGRPLTSFIFTEDESEVDSLEENLKQTEITQPAVLATDLSLCRLFGASGIEPDMVMGHSLGEYGALVAAGALSFESALEAVSARGKEMAGLEIDDNGAMAAVMAPLDDIRRIVDESDGYVVVANVNSSTQAVVGGATTAVEDAIERFGAAGHTAFRIPVSHAFHTQIVAPAGEPLREVLGRLSVREPELPVVANVDGEFYPQGGEGDERMIDILGRQVSSPVQFVKGLETLYDAGARVFVEVGPKKALHGFAEDVLGSHADVVTLFANHPKFADDVAFNRALCGLWAAGVGTGVQPAPSAAPEPARSPVAATADTSLRPAAAPADGVAASDSVYLELGHLFADFLDKGRAIYASAGGSFEGDSSEPVVITGAALGLPGTERVFDDANLRRILDGTQLIDQIPNRLRDHIVEKHITRLVKRDGGDPSFEEIDAASEVIKLAGRAGQLDLTEEFGVEAERVAALDRATSLAVGAGFDALRDAGIPLVMHYKTTSVGSQLPERWMLPEALRDDTGVIFASAFPGYDALVDELDRFHEDKARHAQVEALERIRDRMDDGDSAMAEIDHEIHELRLDIEANPFEFDRRFLFKILSMGHAQFAEMIGARGPNTQVNAACASTTQAMAVAQDWIRAGRCRRVLVIAGDDASSDRLIEWIGSGFLASGAAATDDSVSDAALPFDNRRHGMILGMGAAALVVESAPAARERALQPICEVLGVVTANSAFHGTRLDVDHICQVMEDVVSQAEARGVDRHQIAPETVFVSHETYTPARGGSAAAEIHALRHVFGPDADRVVIANTKGFTGHPMGVGVEDVVAVKALETGIVPPVPNFRDIDPQLGQLNLSQGGAYPVRYALRLAAGFGSQISMALMRWTPVPDGAHREPDELGFDYRITDTGRWREWLSHISGMGDPQLEVATRRLRVVDEGPVAGQAHPPATPTTSPPPQPRPPAVSPAPAATPAPVPAETAAEPAASAPAPAGDPVEAQVLKTVSEATGYPSDMLDIELDLEADLGIDTVKQAEVFATIRESFGIPRDDQLKLRDYPTLSHVLQFVRDRADNLPTTSPTARPTQAPAEPARSAPTSADDGVDAPTPAGDPVEAQVLKTVSEATGYPSDMLDIELDLEADLGIDTVKQAEVFATIRESFGIPRDDQLKLRDYPTLSHVLQFVRDRADNLPTTGAATQPAAEPTDSASTAADDGVEARVLELVSEATGYPSDMLDIELDLEADLGIDTVKQAEVFATIPRILRHPPRRPTQTPRLPHPLPRPPIRPRPRRQPPHHLTHRETHSGSRRARQVGAHFRR